MNGRRPVAGYLILFAAFMVPGALAALGGGGSAAAGAPPVSFAQAETDLVTQGQRISDSLEEERGLFPPTLIQMIGAGEETGKLDVVLGKVSSFYDREVETSLKATTSMIEPLMICVMGVIVGGIALGLLMPIFQLSKPG